jgi:DNA-binding transcriptional regulator YhcF (GntR family)
MDVLPLDPLSDRPPYEQLRAQIASRAASGELPGGTRLPTVRALAAELALATNTVAKAYRALEADGVLVAEGRRGTFVALSARAGSGEAAAAASAYAASARRLGLGLAEAVALLERSWSSV